MSIEIRNVTKRYGDLAVCDNLSLDVPAGELVALLGPSGSGKTTLLRIIAGLTTPAEGEIRWQRRTVRAFDARIRKAVAFNGHLPGLKDELTSAENLAIAIALDGQPAAPAAIDSALDAVSLDRQRSLPVRVLSQGQRRRIGLARLRLVKRPLWVLDEPLTALDADGTAILGELLARHLEDGGLCIAASHQPLPIAPSRMKTITLGAVAP
jgi:heme exporter protein A